MTGLVDAEGSFIVRLYKNKSKLGWAVQAIFTIGLHERDLDLLLQVQKFFGGIGSINKSQNRDVVIYSVVGNKDLISIIIPHFEKYSLLTQKAADFILFQRVIELMSKKAHLEGLYQIINIKAAMNLGLSDDINSNFNSVKIIPVSRPLIMNDNIPDPNWVAGFVTGEGCC